MECPMSRINAEWHQANRMPKKPSFEERVAWHVEHLRNCSCRTELPTRLAEQMRERGMKVPALASDPDVPPGSVARGATDVGREEENTV